MLPKVRYETQGNTVRAVEPLVDGQPDRVRDSHGRPVVLLRRRHDRACVAAANARGNLHYSPGLHREGSITIKLNFFCGVCGYVALGYAVQLLRRTEAPPMPHNSHQRLWLTGSLVWPGRQTFPNWVLSRFARHQ